MTTDKILAAAIEAGVDVHTAWGVSDEAARRFYAIAFQQGMERAAEICDALVKATSNYPEAHEGLTAETKFARGIGECLVIFPNAIRAHAKNQPESTHDTGNA